MFVRYIYALIVMLFSVSTWAERDPLAYDPTTPLHRAPQTVEEQVALELSAILDLGGKRLAIINGSRVYEGDVVGQVAILKVNAKNVVYSHNGKSYTLNMRVSIIE